MHIDKVQKYIQTLSEKIRYYNTKYYQEHQSEISDFEFDKLLKELIDLEDKYPQFKLPDSPTQRVGGTVSKDFPTVKHQYPMLSLGNTYSEEELLDFDKRIKKILTENEQNLEDLEYICELKFDGVSLSLTYKEGLLRLGATRGDGVQGDDITPNVKTIRSVPLKVKQHSLPQEFEVRGEAFMSNDTFEKLNQERQKEGKELYANPRNTASGSLKMQDSSEVAKRQLDAYIYFLLGKNLPFQTHEASIKALEKWGFNVSPTYRKCRSIQEVIQYVREWEDKRKTLPVETDGVVIKVNLYQHQRLLGNTSKSPRWAISYKYKAESASTLLENIAYQVGRTGAITPVAELKPVFLAGTTVKRASLHNANEIERLGLRIGDTVFVEKGGEIIPKVTGTDLSKRPKDSQAIDFITHCPECQTLLVRKEGEAQHFCPNTEGCPPQIRGRIEHFISKKAMDIDSLGSETIQGLLDKGKIKNYAELYSLEYEDILNLAFRTYSEKKDEVVSRSLKEKSAKNLIKGIEASKAQSFERVLFALGIRFVGATVAKKLAQHFKNIDNLAKASEEELIAVEDIGQGIAKSVISFFADEHNQKLIQTLKNAGLQFELDQSENILKSDKFAGKTFVISGVFKNYSREELKAKIEENAGKIVSSVSKKLDYLVAGDKMGSSKLEKAQKFGTKMISEEDFTKML